MPLPYFVSFYSFLLPTLLSSCLVWISVRAAVTSRTYLSLQCVFKDSSVNIGLAPQLLSMIHFHPDLNILFCLCPDSITLDENDGVIWWTFCDLIHLKWTVFIHYSFEMEKLVPLSSSLFAFSFSSFSSGSSLLSLWMLTFCLLSTTALDSSSNTLFKWV